MYNREIQELLLSRRDDDGNASTPMSLYLAN